MGLLKKMKRLELPTISGMLRTQKKAAPPPPAPPQRSSSSEEEPADPRNLLHRNTRMVTEVRNPLGRGRKEKFYFLTLPGLIRIAQVLVAALHVAIFAFYCTYYEDMFKSVRPPLFMGNSREAYFLLVNYYSLLGSITIVLSGITSPKSNTAFMASLFPSLFDFIQFLSVMAASLSLFVFYRREGIIKTLPGNQAKYGITFLGGVLAASHAIECVYSVRTFFKCLDYVENERIPIDEEGNLVENAVLRVVPQAPTSILRNNMRIRN